MEWEKKIGERFFFKLESGAVYTGTIIDVRNVGGITLIDIEDKFGNSVGFRENTIIKYNQESLSKPKNNLDNSS